MSKADAQVIVDIVRDAVKSGEPLWVAVERKIAHNRSAMREVRARMREYRWKPQWHAHYQRVLGRYKSLSRRIRRLRKGFASWRMPAEVVT